MARRRREALERAEQGDRALDWRLSDLLRGATSWGVLDEGAPKARVDAEAAAREAIANSDDERLPLPARVEAREHLLAAMGRLDRALRHVRYMEGSRKRCAEKWWAA
jgi:hypothetical protein